MTTTTTLETRVHPIARFSERALEVVASLRDAPAWAMSGDEQRTALLELTQLEAEVAELRLRVLVAADRNDVGSVDASPSTAARLANATRQTRPAAHTDVALATALDTGHEVTRRALAEGRLNRAQAAVVVDAVALLRDAVTAFEADRLAHPVPGQSTTQVPADLLPRAERLLVAEAARLDAAALRKAGKHLLAVLAPDLADEAEGRRLAREEDAALATASLTMRDNGDGTHSGNFRLPDLHATMLDLALTSLMSTRVSSPGEPGHHQDATGARVPKPQQRGQALCSLLERLPADRLPELGGVSATVAVTVDFADLSRWYASAGLSTGGAISAGEARRLACGAGLLPAVLGGASQVLDLGRERRLFSAAQVKAKRMSTAHCEIAGCSVPAALCEAHHQTWWSRLGRTDLADLTLLCHWHHHRVHGARYDLTRHSDGSLRLHLRT